MVPFLSERIIEIRTKNGLSQSEFSDRIGTDKSMVSHYERGRRQPSLEILRRIASVFHVTTDYLLALENDVAINLSVDTTGLSQEQIESLAKINNTILVIYKKNNAKLEKYIEISEP